MESTSSSRNKDKNVVKRSVKQHKSDAIDYMNYIPEAILFHILSFLPLREMIVMSLLSKRWEDIVVSFISMVPPNINLDEIEMIKSIIRKDLHLPPRDNFTSTHSYLRCLYHLIHAARRKFIQFVDRSLLLHSSCTVNKLQLSFHYDASEVYGYAGKINSWVHYVFTNDISELTLDFSDGTVCDPSDLAHLYALPCGSFAPKILKTLILNFCKLRPLSFQVFESLQKLSLVQVEVFGCSLADIASKCPVLADISLENCIIPEEFMVCEEDIMIKTLSVINCETHEWPIYCIDLSTPCLQMLTLIGSYLMTSHIRNATELIDVFIGISEIHADRMQGDALGSLLIGLNHCRSLTLTTWCIQVLPAGENLLEQLPIAFHNLKHLCLELGLAKQEFPGICCLLQSFPNLEKLTLHMHEPENVDWEEFQEEVPDIFNFEEQTYWETQNSTFNCLHNSLKEVMINGFSESINEMQMLQFLLKKATVLERMDVISVLEDPIPAGNQQQQIQELLFQHEIFLALINFPRASNQACLTIYRSPNPNM